jgi:hypothetical protein
MSLITPFEVIKNAPVRFDFPTANLCDFISDVEEDLFDDKCLLKATYTLLQADLVTYTNVPTYDGNDTYALDDKVLLNGCIFISKVNANTSSPLDTAAWELAPKFETACYNTFWDKFLKRYLAFNITATVMAYATYQAGSKGLTKFALDNTGIQTVNQKEYFEWKTSILYDSARILRNMRSWMLENLTCFPEMDTESCGTSVCDTAPRSRRIAWPK